MMESRQAVQGLNQSGSQVERRSMICTLSVRIVVSQQSGGEDQANEDFEFPHVIVRGFLAGTSGGD
jgi:hypothetical protein